MKFKFKIIPFLISLLIVAGTTFGICWYSYHDYPLNKYAFFDEYFHVEDYEKYSSQELIEDAVKFQYEGYKKASDTINLIENDGKEATYKDGTISIPGYFDIDIYLTVIDNEGEKTYSYYFYFYNVVYQGTNLDPQEEIAVIIVNGIGEGVEDDKQIGTTLLDTTISNLGDDDTDNNPKFNALATYVYSYTYGENNAGRPYPIYDTGYVNEDDDDSSNYAVWRCAPRLDNNNKEIFNSVTFEDGEATFAVVKYNSKKAEALCKGTMTGINDMDLVDYNKGHNGDMYQSYYSSVVIPKVLVHGAIAFVISGVIAFLFYLLWLPEKAEAVTNKKQPKNKR